MRIEYTDGSNGTIGSLTAGSTKTIRYVSSEAKTIKEIVGSNTVNTTYYYNECGIFEGNVPLDGFEPYKEAQTLDIQKPADVPVFLPGIPVSSSGNYIDENGQQWICDEVDFASGEYVQRIGIIDRYVDQDVPGAYMSTTGTLAENARVFYILPEPIYYSLTAEELAQYAALHTNYPNTTIFNDVGADMEVKYVADTKLYIDKKFTELSAALLNQ